jgi:general secretion pathway protein D
MSLGFRFSSADSQFVSGDPLLTQNALQGLFEYEFEDSDGNNTFRVNFDVNALLNLLKQNIDLKIRSEPKILTADNVEGEFFDGQDVPFIKDSVVSSQEAGTFTETFDYFPVGITLRVRPHITEEKTVNLMVNLRMSSVIPGRTLFGGAVVDRRETTTQITLEHGETFMISGILRQEQRDVVTRVPGLGHIPLMGELFTHRSTADVNTEVLVFLTPYVIDTHVRDPSHRPIQDDPQERMEQYWPETEGVGQAPPEFGPSESRATTTAPGEAVAEPGDRSPQRVAEGG